jgi:hypothetical protein
MPCRSSGVFWDAGTPPPAGGRADESPSSTILRDACGKLAWRETTATFDSIIIEKRHPVTHQHQMNPSLLSFPFCALGYPHGRILRLSIIISSQTITNLMEQDIIIKFCVVG